MTLSTPEIKSDYIPLSVAVTLVSYSRDYIGRLAREHKIKAQQIDKQWLVSRESLLNFFEQSAVEDAVKKRILSQSRKNDLEVKDFYTARVAQLATLGTTRANASLLATVVIIFGGLLSGVLVHQSGQALVQAPQASVLQILSTLQRLPSTANVMTATVPPTVFFEGAVVESLDTIPMEHGIVLFPTLRQGDEESVERLFSDEVTVVVTSTTTGFVRFSDGAVELPFVRVPERSSL